MAGNPHRRSGAAIVALGLALGAGLAVWFGIGQAEESERSELARWARAWVATPPAPLDQSADTYAGIRREVSSSKTPRRQLDPATAILELLRRYDVLIVPAWRESPIVEQRLLFMLEAIQNSAAKADVVLGLATETITRSKNALCRAWRANEMPWLARSSLFVPQERIRRRAIADLLAQQTDDFHVFGVASSFQGTDMLCEAAGDPGLTSFGATTGAFIRQNFAAAQEVRRWLVAEDADLRERVCICLADPRRLGAFPYALQTELRRGSGLRIATAILFDPCLEDAPLTRRATESGAWIEVRDGLWLVASPD